MKWRVLGDTEEASGREAVYLIAWDAHGVTMTRFTRGTGSRPVTEAVLNAIVIPGCHDQDLLDIYRARLRRQAEQYEAGHSVIGQPRWQRPAEGSGS